MPLEMGFDKRKLTARSSYRRDEAVVEKNCPGLSTSTKKPRNLLPGLSRKYWLRNNVTAGPTGSVRG